MLGYFLVSLLLGLVHSQKVCTPSDYVLSQSSACEPDVTTSVPTRTLLYKVRNPGECTGSTSLVLNRSCECDLDEYVAAASACDPATHTQKLSGWIPSPQCRPSTLLQSQLNREVTAASFVPCECNEDDIGSLFTPCHADSVSRSVVYFWKRECTPRKNLTLPKPSKIGCRDECSAGSFLGPPNKACEKCPAGTFAIKGEAYSMPWSKWPSNFHTVCSGDGCKPWRLHNETIDSGEQPTSSIVSSLKIWADIVTVPAELTLTFRLSSAMYDDNFFININGARIFSRSGRMPSWETTTLDLHDDGRECAWQIRSASMTVMPLKLDFEAVCIVRNQFEPFNQRIHFDRRITGTQYRISGARNFGCNPEDYTLLPFSVRGSLAFIPRGNCTSVQKVLAAQTAGAVAAILFNNDDNERPFRMSGDSTNIVIPSGFVQYQPGKNFWDMAMRNVDTFITIQRQPVQLGRTEIELGYQKDEFISPRKGRDRVHVKDIRITGTVFAPQECTKCPPGMTSHKGATECVLCPANTYSSEYGAPWPCTPCPEPMVSGPGSTRCQLTPPCGPGDYFPYFSMCNYDLRKRNLTYRPVSPPICDNRNSTYRPPALQEVPCAPCPPGYYRTPSPGGWYKSASLGFCTPCPGGSIPDHTNDNSRGEARSCTACAAGSNAIRTLRYEGFDDMDGRLPGTWTTTCDTCQGDSGWSFMPWNEDGALGGSPTTLLVAGRGGLGDEALLFLRIPVTLQIVGTASIAYRFMLDGNYANDYHAVRVRFRMYKENDENDAQEVILNTTVCLFGLCPSDTASTEPVSPGKYILEFEYRKDGFTNRPILFALERLIVTGEATGGASSCESCPPGYMCPNGYPMPCPEGTYSHFENQTVCNSCLFYEVSSGTANTECTLCAPGTYPNPTRTLCFFAATASLAFDTAAYQPKMLRYDFEGLLFATQIQLNGLRVPTNSSQGLTIQPRRVFYCLTTGPNTPCGYRGHEKGPVAYIEQGGNQTLIGRKISIRTEPRGSWQPSGEIPLPNSPSDKEFTDVVIDLTKGHICRTFPPIEHYSTTIRFICHPQGSTRFKLTENHQCHVAVEVISPYACPLCDNSVHFLKTAGPCMNGHQVEYWTYNSTLHTPTCYGGDPLPAAKTVSCPWSLEIVQDHPNLAVGIAFGTACGVVLLVGAVWYLFVAKRRLYAQYAALSMDMQRNAATEMGDMAADQQPSGPTEAAVPAS